MHAGLIVGFDAEGASVAQAMVNCIEAAAIPGCMAGLLYALPDTQLSRACSLSGARLLGLLDTNLLGRGAPHRPQNQLS